MVRPAVLRASVILAVALSLVATLDSSARADSIPPGGYKPCPSGSELVHGGAGHRYGKSVPGDCVCESLKPPLLEIEPLGLSAPAHP